MPLAGCGNCVLSVADTLERIVVMLPKLEHGYVRWRKPLSCYLCGQAGHRKASCPNLVGGNFEVESKQNRSSVSVIDGFISGVPVYDLKVCTSSTRTLVSSRYVARQAYTGSEVPVVSRYGGKPSWYKLARIRFKVGSVEVMEEVAVVDGLAWAGIVGTDLGKPFMSACRSIMLSQLEEKTACKEKQTDVGLQVYSGERMKSHCPSSVNSPDCTTAAGEQSKKPKPMLVDGLYDDRPFKGIVFDSRMTTGSGERMYQSLNAIVAEVMEYTAPLGADLHKQVESEILSRVVESVEMEPVVVPGVPDSSFEPDPLASPVAVCDTWPEEVKSLSMPLPILKEGGAGSCKLAVEQQADQVLVHETDVPLCEIFNFSDGYFVDEKVEIPSEAVVTGDQAVLLKGEVEDEQSVLGIEKYSYAGELDAELGVIEEVASEGGTVSATKAPVAVCDTWLVADDDLVHDGSKMGCAAEKHPISIVKKVESKRKRRAQKWTPVTLEELGMVEWPENKVEIPSAKLVLGEQVVLEKDSVVELKYLEKFGTCQTSGGETVCSDHIGMSNGGQSMVTGNPTRKIAVPVAGVEVSLSVASASDVWLPNPMVEEVDLEQNSLCCLRKGSTVTSEVQLGHDSHNLLGGSIASVDVSHGDNMELLSNDECVSLVVMDKLFEVEEVVAVKFMEADVVVPARVVQSAGEFVQSVALPSNMSQQMDQNPVSFKQSTKDHFLDRVVSCIVLLYSLMYVTCLWCCSWTLYSVDSLVQPLVCCLCRLPWHWKFLDEGSVWSIRLVKDGLATIVLVAVHDGRFSVFMGRLSEVGLAAILTKCQCSQSLGLTGWFECFIRYCVDHLCVLSEAIGKTCLVWAMLFDILLANFISQRNVLCKVSTDLFSLLTDVSAIGVEAVPCVMSGVRERPVAVHWKWKLREINCNVTKIKPSSCDIRFRPGGLTTPSRMYLEDDVVISPFSPPDNPREGGDVMESPSQYLQLPNISCHDHCHDR